MSSKSCENCNNSEVDIVYVAFGCPTVFGTIDVELSVCKTCRSMLEFCLNHYIESFDYLTLKINNRAKQLSNKNKRGLK